MVSLPIVGDVRSVPIDLSLLQICEFLTYQNFMTKEIIDRSFDSYECNFSQIIEVFFQLPGIIK